MKLNVYLSAKILKKRQYTKNFFLFSLPFGEKAVLLSE